MQNTFRVNGKGPKGKWNPRNCCQKYYYSQKTIFGGKKTKTKGKSKKMPEQVVKRAIALLYFVFFGEKDRPNGEVFKVLETEER